MKYITAPILWLFFVIAQNIALVAGLIGLLLGNFEYTSHIVRAQDRATAALLGWDGNSTVSKECGKSECRFCKILCSILNVVLEKDHCKKEASDE